MHLEMHPCLNLDIQDHRAEILPLLWGSMECPPDAKGQHLLLGGLGQSEVSPEQSSSSQELTWLY